jgi:alkanesulfonate monooxygenase SsuD/methylene tetrahydromethanopterin reductase-like flavin-dependent oxidoreductase (luciferase family)
MGQRLGLIAFWKDYDRDLYLKAAKLADVLGYDSFWVSEAWGYDCTTLLAEMAVKTKNIKLGSGIINVFSRSPALIAMQAATLQEMSGGRFMLGIGTSAKPVIEGLHGKDFSKPLTKMRDVIRVVRALHDGEPLHEAGAIIDDYRPFNLAVDTPVTPRVPIYQASLKQKAITSIGEMADGWMPIFWPYDRFDEGREWIEDGAEKAGRSPSEIVTAPYTTVIPLPGDRAQKQAKEILSFYVGGMGPFYKQLLTDFGWAEECEEIAEIYSDKETRDHAWEAVTDEMVEKLFIAGDPLYCRRELRRRRDDFGMEYPLINLPPNRSWPELAAFLIALAPTRWP